MDFYYSHGYGGPRDDAYERVILEPPPFDLRGQVDGMLDILLRGLLADPAA